MSILSRFLRPLFRKSGESQYRDGPWFLPFSGGWLDADVGKLWNWWQLGGNVIPAGASSAMVEACVAAYAQTISMCPGDHWRADSNGGRERVITSALSRILRKPNGYQSISDFLLNAARSLYLDGNAYALALRNDRFEVAELHLMNARMSQPQIATTGDVFYSLGGNPIIDRRLGGQSLTPVPARDVLHLRLHTPRHPLVGETPLSAAMLDVAATNAMTRQQIAFYANQARPSFVLSTDQALTKDQLDMLRERWNEQSRGLNAGGTPILAAGLKPQPLSVAGKDAALADMMKMTAQNVALVFRVPMQILGVGDSAPFASTESLMRAWIASGLGFALNHIEEALGAFFGLKGVPDEYVEFDTRALLRSAEKERMEALSTSVRGGIRTINEARRDEGLPAVDGGDDIRIQQQDVPLDWHEQQQAAKAAAPVADQAAVDQPAAETDDDEAQPLNESRVDSDPILERVYHYAASSSLH